MINIKAAVPVCWGEGKKKKMTAVNHILETVNHLQNKIEKPTQFASTSVLPVLPNYQSYRPPRRAPVITVKQRTLFPVLSGVTHAAPAPALLPEHVQIPLAT